MNATAPTETPLSTSRRFSDGFYWGVATSSYQIEGAWNEDGKGLSIWDTFAHTPGNIKDDENGDVANDHDHRYTEDVALMKDIGATAYRFSIAWPRIFPEGTGTPNAKGVDFYSRLVDELLAAGIEPFATLYHWDLPQTLHDAYGGWQSAETSKAFADYAGYVAEQLGDRVKRYFTINEFASFVEGGYQGLDVQVGGGKTVHLGAAPGLRLSDSELKQVRHHAVLGHGLAVQAMRARLTARLRRHQCLQTRLVRRALRRTARLPRHPGERVTPEDAIGLARPRPGGHVLGPEADAIDLGR